MKKNKIHVISAAAYILLTYNQDGTATVTSSDAKGKPFLKSAEGRKMSIASAELLFNQTVKMF